jgi:hypothetical protein
MVDEAKAARAAAATTPTTAGPALNPAAKFVDLTADNEDW